ncbi:hypothetical protein RV18_GL003414 [Enterococcus termitis]|nr:hypothetical protein RV18_GL003414 [Enterococcus termitis]
MPIASIVSLKKEDILLMIVGRAQLFNQNSKIGYFDYSATLYPQGIDGSQEFVFLI